MNQVNMTIINQKIQKLIEKYRALEADNNNNLETISKLEQIVDDQKSNIAHLTDSSETKDLQIMTHEDTIKDLNQNIDNLRARRTELEDKVTELQASLEQIGNVANEIDSNLADMFPDLDLTEIDNI